MRILHVSSEYPPQQVFGLGRYVCDLSREMVRQGHVVHVLTNSIGGRDQEVVDEGVHVHRVDFPPPPKPPGAVTPVLAFNLHLQQRSHVLGVEALGNPEVVVSHDWLTALAGHRLSRRLGVPHVWTVHDLVHGKRFGKIETPGDRMTFEIERWAAGAADLVLVNSRAIGEELRREYGGLEEKGGNTVRTGMGGWGRPAIELLHCGIDSARFVSAQDSSRVAEFRRLFAAPDEVLVTYTGRLDLEKGIDTLINAFSAARSHVPGLRLAIVGKGDLRETIEEHVNRLGLQGAVRLYGYLRGEVLKHVYIVSDIHVCPSHYEPFGIVALEAMAAGAPVVASATGGLTDVVTGRSVGRLFPPRDAGALANVLIELAKDPKLRQRLGRAGQRHARERFSWSIIAARAAESYRKARKIGVAA
jgi:glycosyltransferase involved in cell wall biosynthesis